MDALIKASYILTNVSFFISLELYKQSAELIAKSNYQIKSYNTIFENLYLYISKGGINHYEYPITDTYNKSLLFIGVDILLDFGQEIDPVKFHELLNSKLKIVKLPLDINKIIIIPFIGIHYRNSFDKMLTTSYDVIKEFKYSILENIGMLITCIWSYYACNKIPLNDWIFKLQNLLNKHSLFKDIRSDPLFIEALSLINRYIDIKFIDEKKRNDRTDKNLITRIKLFIDRLTLNIPENIYTFCDHPMILSLFVYDCLIDCNGSWETLVIYSSMHFGESIRSAELAGLYYGLVYGLTNVPTINYSNMNKDVLIYIESYLKYNK